MPVSTTTVRLIQNRRLLTAVVYCNRKFSCFEQAPPTMQEGLIMLRPRCITFPSSFLTEQGHVYPGTPPSTSFSLDYMPDPLSRSIIPRHFLPVRPHYVLVRSEPPYVLPLPLAARVHVCMCTSFSHRADKKKTDEETPERCVLLVPPWTSQRRHPDCSSSFSWIYQQHHTQQ